MRCKETQARCVYEYQSRQRALVYAIGLGQIRRRIWQRRAGLLGWVYQYRVSTRHHLTSSKQGVWRAVARNKEDGPQKWREDQILALNSRAK